MTHFAHKDRGFTLLESIIAAGLLSVVITVFLSIGLILVLGPRSERLTIAHQIASSKIDTLRQTSFDAMPGSGSFTNPMLGLLPGSSAQLTIANYRASAQMRHVQVMISWLEAGTLRTHSLDTVITRGATHPPQ